MLLTEHEQKILNGGFGEGMRMAMQIVVKFGEMYGAKKLLEVKDAHIDASSYTILYEAGTSFIEKLIEGGAKITIPASINPCARDIKDWRKTGLSEDFCKKSERLENAYIQLGVIPTWTCAPYQCINTPTFGEHLCWSESNAVNFVNSVIGARTNRLPDLVDVCCAIVKRVPEYGLHLTENRAGNILFEMVGFSDSDFTDSSTFAALGYLVGEIAISRIPVISWLPISTTKDQLKSLSAAAASGGSTALFHVVGITPEAPSIESAFQGKTDYEVIKVTPSDLQKVINKISSVPPGKIDMVLFGCPHASYAELKEVESLLDGRHVAKDTRFWIQISNTLDVLAKRTGLKDALENAGILLIKDTCIMISDTDMDWGFKTLLTNSGKVAQYMPGLIHTDVSLTTTKNCVEAAIKGEW